MKVAVGSHNPVKIRATKSAFKKVWPKKKWNVNGVDVASGVSEQPMSDLESIKGATNRAIGAIKVGKADFGVGMEGGLQKLGRNWFDCGWLVVVDKKRRVGIGSTVKVETPLKLIKLIKQGRELGEVIDLYFKKENSKQGQGHFGLMSNGIVSRTHGYTDGLIMALSRFIHSDLWE